MLKRGKKGRKKLALRERTCYATGAKPPPVGKAYTHLYAAPARKEIFLIKRAEPVILPRRMSPSIPHPAYSATFPELCC
jgi:hypothetical protein